MANEKMQEELRILTQDVARLREDVSDLVESLKELGIEKAESTRGSIEDELRARLERMEAKLHRARERGRGALDDVEERLTEHPLGTLAATFAIGYVIAKLTGGKS